MHLWTREAEICLIWLPSPIAKSMKKNITAQLVAAGIWAWIPSGKAAKLRPGPTIELKQISLIFQSESRCKKINLQKKRLKSKLRRKCVSDLVNEPQRLAKIKTPKILNFPNKGITNLRKSQKKLSKTPRKQTKGTRNTSKSVFQCQG